MYKEKTKKFRDPIHGYIAVPASYCEAFVDTDIFQRLRYIEQTSIRPLYPSAHHDRFAHSLGVFHLACQAFQSLKNTSQKFIRGIDLEKYKHTFLIACLLDRKSVV